MTKSICGKCGLDDYKQSLAKKIKEYNGVGFMQIYGLTDEHKKQLIKFLNLEMKE